MLWETLPELPARVIVEVPAGVPEPGGGGGVVEPLPARPTQPLARITSKIALLNAIAKRLRRLAIRARNTARTSNVRIMRGAATGGRVRIWGIEKPREVVVMDTETDVAEVPLGVTEDGVTVQVEAVGTPVQEKEIGWLKPPSGLTASVRFAGCPALTVALGEEVEREKSIPVPDRLTV